MAYAAGLASTGWANLTGQEPRAPLDAVKMARKKMFVSLDKAKRELGFQSAAGGWRAEARGGLVPGEWLRCDCWYSWPPRPGSLKGLLRHVRASREARLAAGFRAAVPVERRAGGCWWRMDRGRSWLDDAVECEGAWEVGRH